MRLEQLAYHQARRQSRAGGRAMTDLAGSHSGGKKAHPGSKPDHRKWPGRSPRLLGRPDCCREDVAMEPQGLAQSTPPCGRLRVAAIHPYFNRQLGRKSPALPRKRDRALSLQHAGSRSYVSHKPIFFLMDRAGGAKPLRNCLSITYNRPITRLRRLGKNQGKKSLDTLGNSPKRGFCIRNELKRKPRLCQPDRERPRWIGRKLRCAKSSRLRT